MLIYGAHLLRNGAAAILERMMAARLAHAPRHQRRRHDPRLGIRLARAPRPRASRQNVATGTFGTWHETATQHPPRPHGRRPRRRWATAGPWAGSSPRTARRFPTADELAAAIAAEPAHPLDRRPRRPAAGDAEHRAGPPGRIAVEHRWKHASILAQAYRHGVPMTVHPGHRLRHHRQPSRCSTAPPSAGRRSGISSSSAARSRPRRRRRALDRLGDHGPAGLREGA